MKIKLEKLLDDMLKTKKQRIVAAIWRLLFSVSLALLGAYFIGDIKLFFGVFLLLWANNVGNSK